MIQDLYEEQGRGVYIKRCITSSQREPASTDAPAENCVLLKMKKKPSLNYLELDVLTSATRAVTAFDPLPDVGVRGSRQDS